jgi:hypothetical protein
MVPGVDGARRWWWARGQAGRIPQAAAGATMSV